MGSGTAGAGTGGVTERGARRLRPGWLANALARWRADLSPAAMDRRILHRLSSLSDRELRGIGFVRRDLDDARLPGVEDVSTFLIARREARRALRRRLSGGTAL